MKKTVVSYLTSVPRGNTNVQKEELQIKFYNGVLRTGDSATLHRDYHPIDCDAAVIQGWVYSDVNPSHLQLRKKVINHQIKNNKHTIVADANLFLYADKKNRHGYLRYSLNGVFPNTGIYCDDIIDEQRWNKISINSGLQLQDYKKDGDHILLLLQRQGGWSMSGESVIDWTISTIEKIRSAGCKRRIKIRAHPGCKQSRNFFIEQKSNPFRHLKKVEVVDPNNWLQNDLQNCYAVVNKNSSGIVGPIIQGYHAFTTDPTKSQCAEVSNHSILDIDNPKEFDRLKWLRRISMFHWNFQELESGECWNHIRNYCQ